MPHSTWSVARNYFLLATWGPLTVIAGSIGFLAGFKQGGIVDALEGFLAVQLLVLPLSVVFVIAGAVGFRMQRPTVRLRNGQLEVRSGDVSSQRIAISECEWFVGSVAYTTTPQQACFCRGTAVLIAYPSDSGQPRERVASVGFSEETRRSGVGLLTLSGLLRRTAYEARSRWRWPVNLLGILLMIGSFVLTGFTVPHVEEFLFRMTGEKGIAKLVSFQLFVPGSVYAFLYLLVLWPWGAHKRVPAQRDPAELRKHARKCQWWILVVAAFKIVVPILLWTKFSLYSRLVAGAFGLIIAALVGFDLGNRLAAWEPKKQT
jgi:hypothetical protein